MSTEDPTSLGTEAGGPSPLARPVSSPTAVAMRWGTAAGLVMVLAWLSLTREGWVPFLSGVDLGVHEFGHLLLLWAPALWMSLAGSVLQVAAPAALAGYFWWRGDRFAVVLLAAWAGMSLNNVSVYINDATRMQLALFGDDGSGAGHDWRNILGELGWLEHTDTIATGVRILAVLAFGAALALAAWFARSDLNTGRADEKPPADWSHLPRRAG